MKQTALALALAILVSLSFAASSAQVYVTGPVLYAALAADTYRVATQQGDVSCGASSSQDWSYKDAKMMKASSTSAIFGGANDSLSGNYTFTSVLIDHVGRTTSGPSTLNGTYSASASPSLWVPRVFWKVPGRDCWNWNNITTAQGGTVAYANLAVDTYRVATQQGDVACGASSSQDWSYQNAKFVKLSSPSQIFGGNGDQLSGSYTFDNVLLDIVGLTGNGSPSLNGSFYYWGNTASWQARVFWKVPGRDCWNWNSLGSSNSSSASISGTNASTARAASSAPAYSTNLQVSQLLSDTYAYDVNKTITGTALQIDASGGNKIIVYSSSNSTNETERMLAVLDSTAKNYLFLYKKPGYNYYTSTPSFSIKYTSQFNIVKLYSDTYRYDGSNYLTGVSLKITATNSYAVKATRLNGTQYYADNMLSVIDSQAAAFHHIFKITGNDYYTTATSYTLVPRLNSTAIGNTNASTAKAIAYNSANTTNKTAPTIAKTATVKYNYTNTTNKTPSTVAKTVATTATTNTVKPGAADTAPPSPPATVQPGATGAASSQADTAPSQPAATAGTKPASSASVSKSSAGSPKGSAEPDIVNSMADTSGNMYAKLMNILGVYVASAK